MARTKLYLTEHMNAAGITDGAMAKTLGVSRHTILRARQNPDKMPVTRLQAFAEALGLPDWKDLTYPPNSADKLAVVASEATEALDDWRAGKK